MKSLEINVVGKVQGVWFRKYTLEKANELKLLGTVRNLTDGSVFIEAMGEDSTLDEFVRWLHIGSPKALVEGVNAEQAELKAFQDFRIIR